MARVEDSCAGVWAAFALSTCVALLFVAVVCALAATGRLASYASRKLLHIGIGPLFVLCWRLFPAEPLPSSSSSSNSLLCSPRCVAALIPGAITLVFAVIGLGLLTQDFGLVRVMSRSGTNAAEILRGPLIYGVVHVVVTLACWLDTPAGVVALAMLCGGDGFAEVFGRRWGHLTGPVPWARRRGKTLAGTLGFVLCGFVTANVLLWSCARAVAEHGGTADKRTFRWSGGAADQAKLLLVCGASSLVETAPVREIDNALVPLVAVLLSRLFWS